MNSVLAGLPTEPLSAEQEQDFFVAGDTETVVLHALAPAFNYAQNVGRGKVKISQAEILSLCWTALSKSIKTFKPGMKSFLVYSKPFLRGELCKHWRDRNVVRDSYRHETPTDDEFPKPLADDRAEFGFDGIHWREQRAQVEPVIRKALTPIEIRVLELRFKLSYTLEAAGKEIGKSRERVRQIEAKALQKLRAALSNPGEL